MSVYQAKIENYRLALEDVKVSNIDERSRHHVLACINGQISRCETLLRISNNRKRWSESDLDVLKQEDCLRFWTMDYQLAKRVGEILHRSPRAVIEKVQSLIIRGNLSRVYKRIPDPYPPIPIVQLTPDQKAELEAYMAPFVASALPRTKG